jgi:predicted TPR repeat methyltransferase
MATKAKDAAMSDHQTTLARAIAAHQAGRLNEAAAGYQRVLRKRPTDADALHFFGLLSFHRGKGVEAVKLIMRSLSHAPQNPHAWNNLGNVLVTQDKNTEAREAYRRATVLAPAMSEAWYNLGICLRDEGDFAQAAEHFRTAITHHPTFLRAYETLGRLLYRLGDFAKAAEIYGAWLVLDPDNPVARHMAAATSGTNAPPRAEDRYIANLFDRYAAAFDDNLMRLGYRAPELVAATLAQHLGPTAGSANILDAGCGTGLCAPLLRPLCSRLVGVDLSGKMIEQAQARGGYDELAVGELCAFMRSRPDQFDAIVSADTLVYFGGLEEACQAAHHALRVDGVFVFTVEALLDADVAPHRLMVHGRYAHRDSYVHAVLEEHGFSVLQLRRETLRMERLQEVIGHLVMARRCASGRADAPS